jgi:hypothetical protein
MGLARQDRIARAGHRRRRFFPKNVGARFANLENECGQRMPEKIESRFGAVSGEM